jgi:hypothetical protein
MRGPWRQYAIVRIRRAENHPTGRESDQTSFIPSIGQRRNRGRCRLWIEWGGGIISRERAESKQAVNFAVKWGLSAATGKMSHPTKSDAHSFRARLPISVYLTLVEFRDAKSGTITPLFWPVGPQSGYWHDPRWIIGYASGTPKKRSFWRLIVWLSAECSVRGNFPSLFALDRFNESNSK